MNATAATPTRRGRPRRSRTPPAPRLADKIVMRAVNALVTNPKNSRTHSTEQVAKIAASIKRFGFTMPLLVDGAGVVIAGHGRLLAARELGFAEVPTIDGSYLSEPERRAYMIADNQIGLSQAGIWIVRRQGF